MIDMEITQLISVLDNVNKTFTVASEKNRCTFRRSDIITFTYFISTKKWIC